MKLIIIVAVLVLASCQAQHPTERWNSSFYPGHHKPIKPKAPIVKPKVKKLIVVQPCVAPRKKSK